MEEKLIMEKIEQEKKMYDLIKKQKRKIKTDKKMEDWRNNDGVEGPGNGITTTQMILMFRAKQRKQERMLRKQEMKLKQEDYRSSSQPFVTTQRKMSQEEIVHSGRQSP